MDKYTTGLKIQEIKKMYKSEEIAGAVKLAREIDKRYEQAGACMDVLLEVNMAQEETKQVTTKMPGTWLFWHITATLGEENLYTVWEIS